MMLGCDKGRTTKRGVGDDKDDKELMDDEEEKDKIEEVERDGFTNEVESFEGLDNVEGEKQGGNK